MYGRVSTKIRVSRIVPGVSFSGQLSFAQTTSPLVNGRWIQTKAELNHLPLTKIVATIGPASEQLPILPQAVSAGMRIMRLNFSHATLEEVNLRMKNLKSSPGVHASGRNMLSLIHI